ncbi:MAG: VapC toxin family PIN domain ribonuclease [Verrucomicrobia bacterium]|nr:VapC toxin family PIN domain ribonuclease [Verrucomicrobiota bacterium]
MQTLLDNDVFFSALVRSHPSHVRSRRWLDKVKPAGWGIAAETYLATVRLLMNPKVMGSGALSAPVALAAVETELSGSHPGLVVVAPKRPARSLLERATGHRQIMDTWLVQIARDTGGKLATHDTGLLSQWPEQTIRVD